MKYLPSLRPDYLKKETTTSKKPSNFFFLKFVAMGMILKFDWKSSDGSNVHGPLESMMGDSFTCKKNGTHISWREGTFLTYFCGVVGTRIGNYYIILCVLLYKI